MLNSNCLQYKSTPSNDLNTFSKNMCGVWVNNANGSFINAPTSNAYFVNNYKSINNYMYQLAVQYQSKEIYIRSLVSGSWINSWNRIPLISNHIVNIRFPKTTESDVYFSLDKICDHNPIFFIVRGHSENINTGSFTAVITYMLSTSIIIFNDTEFMHNISISHDGNNLILKRNASRRDDLNIFIDQVIIV